MASATIGQPETANGNLPGGGGLEHLPLLLGRARALEVALSSDDYSGELAERYGLSKREENRAVARLIYQLCREQAPQEVIEDRAYAEGERLGLTRDDVLRVALWIASKAKRGRAA